MRNVVIGCRQRIVELPEDRKGRTEAGQIEDVMDLVRQSFERHLEEVYA